MCSRYFIGGPHDKTFRYLDDDRPNVYCHVCEEPTAFYKPSNEDYTYSPSFRTEVYRAVTIEIIMEVKDHGPYCLDETVVCRRGVCMLHQSKREVEISEGDKIRALVSGKEFKFVRPKKNQDPRLRR